MLFGVCAGLTSLLGQVGEAVAVLHDGGLVHGDLTTSNMLVRESDGALVRRVIAACLLGQVHCSSCPALAGMKLLRRSSLTLG